MSSFNYQIVSEKNLNQTSLITKFHQKRRRLEAHLRHLIPYKLKCNWSWSSCKIPLPLKRQPEGWKSKWTAVFTNVIPCLPYSNEIHRSCLRHVWSKLKWVILCENLIQQCSSIYVWFFPGTFLNDLWLPSSKMIIRNQTLSGKNCWSGN